MTSIRAVRIIDHKPVLSKAHLPEPEDGEIRIKVEAVGANPTDYKSAALLDPKDNGAISGCDVAGVVDKVGKNVTSAKVGDRVSGFTNGTHRGSPEQGGYADYAILVDHIYSHIPKDISFERASSWGIQITTVALAFDKILKLPLGGDPTKNKSTVVLIWGGSTSVGHAAIQLASQSGYRIIATASPRNFAAIEKLGAEKVFDYHDSDIVEKIKSYTKDSLEYALDTISIKDQSSIAVAKSFGPKGGKLAVLFPVDVSDIRKDVAVNDFKDLLAYTALNHRVMNYGCDIPASPKDHAIGDQVWKWFEKLVAEGKYQPMPIKVLPNGLESVSTAFDLLRNNKVHHEKLVIRIADTPSK